MAIMQQNCPSCEKVVPAGIGVCPYCRRPVGNQAQINRRVLLTTLLIGGFLALMALYHALISR